MRKPFAAMLILMISCVSLAGCGAPTDSGQSGRRIIFQSLREAPLGSEDFQANYQRYFELYIMNEDGSGVQRITDNLGWENQPDVSPDGQRILFAFHDLPDPVDPVQGTDPGWEIAVMDLDGSHLTKLTNDDYMEFMPDWNYDGTRIVFMADANQRTAADLAGGLAPQYQIFTMDADGGNVTQLTFGNDPGEVNGDPSFSLGEPSRIVYIHTDGYSDGGDLYTMDADGTNQRLILKRDAELLKMNDPAFSPDGSRIIFGAMVREDEYGNPVFNLFTVSASGGELTRITEDDGESDILAQYSPDGSRITYMTWIWNGPGTGDFRIRVADPNGSNERDISSFQWEQAPAWVP